MNSKKLFIMRGPPGAGKSTLLSRTAPSAVVCSADNFFIRDNGQYVFEGAKLKQAHDYCFGLFSIAMTAGDPVVGVDNTNMNWKSMSRYVEAGLAAGYEVELLDVQTPSEIAAARGIHNVPVLAVHKMAAQQLNIPFMIATDPRFKHTVIK